MCRWLKTAFSKFFVFKKSYIFFFFPQKLKQKYSLFILLLFINSDIIHYIYYAQETRVTFYFNLMFSKKIILKKVSD